MRTQKYKVRKPAVAGLFYPQAQDELSSLVDKMLAGPASKPSADRVMGIISPHAGYVYSGHVAAEAFRQLRGRKYETVVILSPSHHDYIHGGSVFPGDYQTPLGTVELDRTFVEHLTENCSALLASDKGHGGEHAIEVQVPFLQNVLGDFKIVPIAMGVQDLETCRLVAESLAEISDSDKTLFVASSDLSHFHEQSQANRLDHEVIRAIEDWDPEKFYAMISAGKGEACGAGPIMIAMMASRELGADRAEVLSYHTSGEISNDYASVVGYLAAAIYKTEKKEA